MKLKLNDALVVFNYHCTYEKNLTEKTLKAYSIDLNQFKDYKNYHDIVVNKFNKQHIKDYVKSLYDRELKAKSIKRKVACLKVFFNFLMYEDVIEISPFTKMKLAIKLPLTLPKPIDMKDIRSLLKYLYSYKSSIENKKSFEYKWLVRDIAVVELLFITGIRVSELANLKPKNIDINKGIVFIFGKGRKEREIQICNKDVKKSLNEYYKLYKNEIAQIDYFFINKFKKQFSEDSVRYMLTKYEKICGIKNKITPHKFRHTVATELFYAGADVYTIQKILGHTSLSTTQIYTKVNNKHQKKVLETKHPRKNITLK